MKIGRPQPTFQEIEREEDNLQKQEDNFQEQAAKYSVKLDKLWKKKFNKLPCFTIN